MIGRRVHPDERGSLTMRPGDYGRGNDGLWWVRPPVGGSGTLDDHEVEEHEDGTITVTPSIQGDMYHGYLERGVWRSM